MADTDLRAAVRGVMTAPRQVTASARFRGGPGREGEAAAAWAFELTYYFTRGVGEPPRVSYEDGIYTVTGLIQTTHPGDGPDNSFTGDEPLLLDSVLRPGRERYLRELYSRRSIWFDGRAHPAGEPGPQPGRRDRHHG
jgi:hypothetical protein